MKLMPSGAVILAYHNVSVDGAERTPGVDELTVTESQLRTHIRMLRLLRFQVVDVARIAELVAQGQDPSGLAAITFDDALAGVANVALPVLADAGVTATIFVPTAEPGRAPKFWPGAEATMTIAQLSDAAAAGHTLGSHTATHRSLVSLQPTEVRDELLRSKAELESITGTPVRSFAYPSGHHSPGVREAVVDAGYTSACTFLNGRATAEVDHLRMPRLTMGAHSAPWRFAYHLARPARSWPHHQHSVVGPSPIG